MAPGRVGVREDGGLQQLGEVAPGRGLRGEVEGELFRHTNFRSVNLSLSWRCAARHERLSLLSEKLLDIVEIAGKGDVAGAHHGVSEIPLLPWERAVA